MTDVGFAVVSMSARADDGTDAAYLEWHLLDHLPEQYRLPGIRLGQRWVSTPGCRALRAASAPSYDEVDHVVAYLFAAPFGPALDAFFDLGRSLHGAGRIPSALPRVDLAAYELEARQASGRVLVDAAVVPWRPGAGAYLIVDGPDATPVDLDDLSAVDGVAGAWRWRGSSEHRPDRLAPRAGITLTVTYLDGEPEEVAGGIGNRLRAHWAGGRPASLLAGPFHAVVPGDWSRHLP